MTPAAPQLPSRPVSRAFHKLAAALDAFGVTPAGRVCADLGCNVGGFTHVLLARGAARVYAVDTATKLLDYSLRRHPAVVVMEGVNALHATPPEAVDLVAIDVGWTRQGLILPAAARWLRPGGEVLSLLKPHYEATADELERGRLPDERVETVVTRVLAAIAAAGWAVQPCPADGRPWVASPIRGSAGNQEVLLHLRRA